MATGFRRNRHKINQNTLAKVGIPRANLLGYRLLAWQVQNTLAKVGIPQANLLGYRLQALEVQDETNLGPG